MHFASSPSVGMLCRMQPKKYALPLMVLSLAATSVAHARGTIDLSLIHI